MEKKAEEGPNVRKIEFVRGVEQITLDTPRDQDTSRDTWEKDGWSLCPLSSSSLKVWLIAHPIHVLKFLHPVIQYNARKAVEWVHFPR